MIAGHWRVLAVAVALVGSAARAQPPTEEADVDHTDIVVTGLRATTTVAKQGVEIRDLPEAITIVPKQVLDEAAARRFDDISYSTVGLTPYAAFANATSSGGYSRGFLANQLVDGRAQAFGFSGTLNLIDRVEVLRGPTSVLYGQGDPGGSINLVLKRAPQTAGLDTSVTLDSTGTRLFDLDAGAPLVGDGLSGRIVAQVEDSTTFRDFEKNRRLQVAPIVHAEPWQGLTIDALASFDRYDFTPIRDYLIFDTPYFSIDELRRIPLSRNLSEPTLPLSRIDTRIIDINIEQALGGGWALGGTFYDYRQNTSRYFELVNFERVPGTTIHNRILRIGSRIGTNRTWAAHIRGAFNLLGSSHRLYVGAEHLDSADNYFDAYYGPYLPIDSAAPVYQSTFVAPALTTQSRGGQSSATDAVYANDLIDLGERLKLQLGLRYDSITTIATYGDPVSTHDTKLSPSAGIVWRPAESTSLYASYSTAFVPQAGRTRLGDPLRPERSTAYEIGIKQELFARRLSVTLAAFDITKDGVVQSDPVDPGNSVLNGGTARSDGFELEFDGRLPVPGLSIRGGVAYAYARITQSTDFTPGDVLVGPRPLTALLSFRQTLDPLHVANAWVSASIFYGGKAVAETPDNGQEIPAFTRIDLAAAKRFGPFELQVNVKNLLDQRIFIGNGGGRVVFDNPRSFGATLRYRFGSQR